MALTGAEIQRRYRKRHPEVIEAYKDRIRKPQPADRLPRREGVKFGTHPTPAHVRFWKKVKKTDDCWEWTGAKIDGGRFLAEDRKLVQAHNFSWTLQNGPVPEGKELDHLCRNPCCVRPSHLEPVTRQINLLRGDTLPAKQASQTHCIHGHEFSQENTYRHKGHRYCKRCRRERTKLWSRRKRAESGSTKP